MHSMGRTGDIVGPLHNWLIVLQDKDSFLPLLIVSMR